MKRIRRLPFQGQKRATAGIIAAVILFTMLFTVGSGFFVFVNSQNQLYVKSLASRTTGVQDSIYESLSVTAILQSGNIKFYANNTGSLPVNITAAFVLDSSGNVLKCLGAGIPSGSACYYSTTALSAVVNVGKASSTIDTGYTYVSGTDVVKVLTARGNTFTGQYPSSAGQQVASALSSGAIGDLYLKHDSYNYYQVVRCQGATAWCLVNKGKAFDIPISNIPGNCSGNPANGTACGLAFSVRVTNLNKNQYTIVLDQYSLTTLFWSVGSSYRTSTWYIISNSSAVIQSSYTQVSLTYDVPKTIVFASGNCIGSSPCGSYTALTMSGATAPTAGTLAGVNLITHGCLNVSPCTVPSSTNYGQNSPYVSSLFS